MICFTVWLPTFFKHLVINFLTVKQYSSTLSSNNPNFKMPSVKDESWVSVVDKGHCKDVKDGKEIILNI